MQKGNILIFLLIGILVIGGLGGAYYLGTQKQAPVYSSPLPVSQSSAPTPDETTSWKTYTNTVYGYSFKYPVELYSLSDTNPTYVFIEYCPTKNPEDCAAYPASLQVEVVPNANIEAEIAKRQVLEGCWMNDSRVTINKTDYLGYKATIITNVIDQETANGVCKGVPLEGGGKYKKVYLQKASDVYILSTTIIDDKEKLDQILSTFKFTN